MSVLQAAHSRVSLYSQYWAAPTQLVRPHIHCRRVILPLSPKLQNDKWTLTASHQTTLALSSDKCIRGQPQLDLTSKQIDQASYVRGCYGINIYWIELIKEYDIPKPRASTQKPLALSFFVFLSSYVAPFQGFFPHKKNNKTRFFI